MSQRQPVLETSRLVFFELEPDDIDFVATMLGHPDVSRYYPKRYSRQDSEVWLERQMERYRRDGHGLWLVQEKTEQVPVGQIGLALQEVEKERLPEVGWLLHRPFWGRGYATEAGAAARDAAFGRFGYKHVISLIRPENEPSRRVAERIGMTPGRTVLFHGFTHTEYFQDAPLSPASAS